MNWLFITTILCLVVAILVWLAHITRLLRRTLHRIDKQNPLSSTGDTTKQNPQKVESVTTKEQKNPIPPVKETAPQTNVQQAPTVPRRIIHDLNNLIGTISGFADAALEDVPKTDPIAEDLKEIREAALRTKGVIEELNAYSPKKTSAAIEKPRQTDPHTKRLNINSTEETVKLSPTDRKPIPRGSEHLLIIDDEEALLRMLERFFVGLGYQVTTFSDSINALETYQQQSDLYDLVILDQRMPEMNGSTLAKEMLSIRPDFPVVLISGYTDTLSPEDATRIGIKRFLSKPIPQVELGNTIRQVLDEC